MHQKISEKRRLQIEGMIARSKTHGLSNTSIYHAWESMIDRCTNPKHRAYFRYGGRGISVCEKWKTFSGFYEDMGPKPEGLTLERVNNSLGYNKENCRWVSMREQARNKSSNRFVEYNGERMIVADAVKLSGIPRTTFYRKYINKGHRTIKESLEFCK